MRNWSSLECDAWEDWTRVETISVWSVSTAAADSCKAHTAFLSESRISTVKIWTVFGNPRFTVLHPKRETYIQLPGPNQRGKEPTKGVPRDPGNDWSKGAVLCSVCDCHMNFWPHWFQRQFYSSLSKTRISPFICSFWCLCTANCVVTTGQTARL